MTWDDNPADLQIFHAMSGALISATDPVATIALFGSSRHGTAGQQLLGIPLKMMVFLGRYRYEMLFFWSPSRRNPHILEWLQMVCLKMWFPRTDVVVFPLKQQCCTILSQTQILLLLRGMRASLDERYWEDI